MHGEFISFPTLDHFPIRTDTHVLQALKRIATQIVSWLQNHTVICIVTLKLRHNRLSSAIKTRDILFYMSFALSRAITAAFVSPSSFHRLCRAAKAFTFPSMSYISIPSPRRGTKKNSGCAHIPKAATEMLYAFVHMNDVTSGGGGGSVSTSSKVGRLYLVM
jgi:hypothetical protein